MSAPSVSGSQDPRTTLRVRINQIDHVMVQPGSLDKSTFPWALVIRIYGASSVGRKACVHVHQVYPYFFVEYNGDLDPKRVKRYIAKLTHSLNHAIAVSLKRDPDSVKAQYVRAIVLVKGIHFYGYHASYSPFLKVLIIDPQIVRRAITILQSPTVMSTQFRVFESHLNYQLQFLSDFGLYGCGWMDLAEVFERGTGDDEPSLPPFKPSSYFRQSRMTLEVDVVAHQILNRHRLAARNIHHERPEPPFPPEPLVPSVRELWEDERERRRARGLDPSPEMPVDPSDASRGAGGDWVSEARYWEDIQHRIEQERQEPPEPVDPSAQSWEKHAMTTFESIEALWDEQWRTWRPGGKQARAYEHVTSKDEGDEGVDVDMSVLITQGMEGLDEDEEGWTGNYEPPRVPEGGKDDTLEDFDDDDVRVERHVQKTAEGYRHILCRRRDRRATAREFTLPDIVKSFDLEATEASDDDNPRPNKRRRVTIDAKGVTIDDCRRLMPDSQTPSVPSRNSPPRTIRASLSFSHFSFAKTSQRTRQYVYTLPPPSTKDLLDTVDDVRIPCKVYRAPFYSKETDGPERPREFAGLVYHLKGGNGLATLSEWDTGLPDEGKALSSPTASKRLIQEDVWGWEYAGVPPSPRTCRQWLRSTAAVSGPGRSKSRSQIEGPTQANIYGLKASPGDTTAHRERQDMTMFSLEVLVPTRGHLVPDSAEDPIAAVFYCQQEANGARSPLHILAVDAPQIRPERLRGLGIQCVDTELDLLNQVVDVVVDLDPDIIAGWEAQTQSWGYLVARGNEYGLDIPDLIARAPARRAGNAQGIDRWGLRKGTTLKVPGRHVMNIWRVMRTELTLSVYSFENVAFHVLRQRVPQYSHATLARWYNSDAPHHTAQAFRYMAQRTVMDLEILEESEVVTKNAEFARVFGVDFYSVLTRGSQFKVESFMFRIAKPESYVLLSPSKIDVGKQNAAECMPLIMEPTSAFYSSPLLVLDFQSLYPSVMIAYNYSYDTCLGRITPFQGRYKFGVTDLNLPKGLYEDLQGNVNVSPNGIAYVKPNIRRGLLARMLTELLDTRVMVKQAMKGAVSKVGRRHLVARQLGLKYISNVTYGYTSATYSGRMPAVEIADSIVQTGRETLEKAIDLINSHPKWGAQVVYGDTDSVFVYLLGKTKEQAFRIGYEMADTITALNPKPIKLKFEKVYLPCVLLAKKRYVGFKYESVDETEPSFDAKGIETVRRDGVLAQQKMTETCLKILFRTQDLSEVKEYCLRSWTKLMENRASVQDFVFAKEVKMGSYSDKGPPPPGVTVAARRTAADPNAEPQYAERVRYVIARGLPGSRLVERAHDPLEFLNNSQLRLDAVYYITRILIPPLERIFNLIGADVRYWYDQMPKVKDATQGSPKKSPRKGQPNIGLLDALVNIEDHFQDYTCLRCGAIAVEGLCDDCLAMPQTAAADLLTMIRTHERRSLQVQSVCASCSRVPQAEAIQCESLDCPWLYARKRTEGKAEFLAALRHAVGVIQNESQSPISLVVDW
ncbi:hypothetical protein BD626DRAFT_613855 [Schizophyllum amplum]|uniref:DNA polymerase n=1 Tax=Schizophyllum amplum TaxID=97359 RepID=A0A550CNE5_9AGAR|nr:hypothetical protein BD626DRAFT_613855 [Auriculariopsis ampla]